jgi:hypothetical protein
MSNVTYRPFMEKLGGVNPLTFIGNHGDLFYDPFDGILRISDGVTQGGTTISGANAIITVVDGGTF